MIASQVLNEVRRIARDQGSLGAERWDDSTLLSFLDRSIRTVIDLAPTLNATYTEHPLVAGDEQSAPIAVVQIIDIPNTTTGGVLTKAPRGVLDLEDPGWRISNIDATPLHWWPMGVSQRAFEVYPAQPSPPTTTVRIYHSFYPPVLVNENSTTALDERFERALSQHVLYQAYAEDSNNPEETKRSMEAFNVFQSEVAVYVEGVA